MPRRTGVAVGDGWRHALLQLEVDRALRGSGTVITDEPKIDGSANRADLIVTRPDGTSFLVETTSLARADADMAWEEYEHRLWQASTALELRYDVRITVHLVDYLDKAETSLARSPRRHPPAQPQPRRSETALLLSVTASVLQVLRQSD